MSDNDIKNIDDIIKSFFSIFDNRQGRTPNFSHLYEIFMPGAIITKLSDSGLETMSLDDFIRPRKALLSDGTLTEFHEWETTRQTVIKNGIATRICSYEKKGIFKGKLFSGIGEKHIQLVRSKSHWMIASVIWVDEDR